MKYAYVLLSCLLGLSQARFDMPLVRRNVIKGKSEQLLEEGSLYAVKVTIGNQEMHLAIDTGSADILLVGSDCITYEENSETLGCDKEFHKGQYEAGKCNLSKGFYNRKLDYPYLFPGSQNICYGDGTRLVFDTYSIDVLIAGVKAHNQYFGIITEQFQVMWQGQNAGILGIGYSANSVINSKWYFGTGLTDTMANAAQITNEFAMCFDKNHSWSIENGGRLILGG
eukprot:Ihof_evm5s481 gene=Ihof_evmTU5s481